MACSTSLCPATVKWGDNALQLRPVTMRIQSWLMDFTSRPGWDLILLVAITIAAAGLRLFRLGQWSFWEDEAFTLSEKEDGFNFSLWRRSFALILIRLVTDAAGTNEWTARLVPAIFGIITIPILYFIIRRLFGRMVALVFSALLAVSTWHIYWSQNVRFYSLLILFYTVALLLFYIAMEEDRPWLFLAALFFLGLAARERLIALFFIPVAVAYILLLLILPIEKPPGLRLRNLAIFFLPGLIAGIPLIGPYLSNLPEWFVNFGHISSTPFWIFSGVMYYIGISTICIAVFWAARLIFQKNRAGLYFTLGAVIPLLLLLALAVVQYTANRYIFVSVTSWLILASFAVKGALGDRPHRNLFLALTLFVILISTPLTENYLYYTYQNGNRADWKAAFRYIESHRQAGDLVVSPNAELGRYYLQGSVVSLPYFIKTKRFSSDLGQVWVVEDLSLSQDYPQYYRWLTENAQLMAVYDVSVRARLFKMRVYLISTSSDESISAGSN